MSHVLKGHGDYGRYAVRRRRVGGQAGASRIQYPVTSPVEPSKPPCYTVGMTEHSQPLKYQGLLQRQQAFLEAYSRCGTVSHACEAAGISRTTVYNDWRQDPGFVEQMETAHAAFGDYLQSLALQKVQRLESKDNLLHLAMLNAHVPHLYAPDRKHQQTTQVNISETVIHIHDYRNQEPPQVVESSHRNLEPAPETDGAAAADTATDTGS